MELESIAFEIVEAEGHTAHVHIVTRLGWIEVLAELREDGAKLLVTGLHTHSQSGPGRIGVAMLRKIADAAMEELEIGRASCRERVCLAV